MARKKKEKKDPPPPGAPLWMVTYSDMVTLLLTFFVMQLAMANFEDPGKVDAALESIRAAFGSGGFEKLSKIIEKDESGNNDLPEVKTSTQHTMVATLRHVLANQLHNDMIRMTTDVTEIRLRVNEQVFFAPGSSQIHPSGRGIITDITKVLAGHKVQIIIEGHSDADGSDEFLNWKLSADRSVSVIEAMRTITNKDNEPLVNGRFIEARGMGEFRPIEYIQGQRSSNWNRRVEVVIRGADSSTQSAMYEIEEALKED
jgi:chemotaxis protein MotB